VKSVRTIQASCGALLLGATTFCSAATVNSVRVWSGPDSTRVVFELTAPVEHRVSTLADPARIVIDLPDTKAAGPLSLPEPKGVVAAVRAGSRSGDLRVVLELTKAAKAKTFLLTRRPARAWSSTPFRATTRRSCATRRRYPSAAAT